MQGRLWVSRATLQLQCPQCCLGGSCHHVWQIRVAADRCPSSTALSTSCPVTLSYHGMCRCFPCTRDLVDLFNEDRLAKIVFATDPDCYPDTWKAALYPSSPSHAPEAYQFLNSGTYIGRTRHILHLLAQHLLHQGLLTENPKFSDQGLFGNLFLAQYYGMHQSHDPRIRLDYAGRYFQVFDTRQTQCWKQDLATKQVTCLRMFTAEACLLHTAGHKAFFYEQLVPRWVANETDLY